MSAVRIERLLNLLTLLLNTRRPISLRELRELDEFIAYCAADPKTGERAFERDKAALVELGVPLRWIPPEEEEDIDGGFGLGGYIIDRDRYYLPELKIEPSQLALLSIAGAAAVAIEHFPGRAAIIRALAKLGFDVEESGSRPVGVAHLPVQAGVDPKRVGYNLEVLHDAVARRVRVRAVYESSRGERSERKIDPYGLYYRQGAWYLIGYCHLRQSERTFHLGRMVEVERVENKSNGDEFEAPDGFNLSAHAGQRPWEFPNEPPFEVAIRLAPRLVPAVAEIFGSRAQVEPCADGAVVRITASHRAALIAAVLPYGAAAEVLEPAELRAQIGAMYEDLATRYLASPQEQP